MLEQLGAQVNEAVVNVAAAAVALGAAYVTYYFKQAAGKVKAETGRIQDQAKTQMIWYALDRLEDTAEKAVRKFEQTIAGELRQSVKDGKVDRSELLALGQKAYKEVLQTLEPELVNLLNDNLGNLQAYVLNTVEALVNKLKNAKEV